jgi:hypothetical protein
VKKKKKSRDGWRPEEKRESLLNKQLPWKKNQREKEDGKETGN